MISRFFIDRPVLANVLALVFVLIGLVSLVQLPSAQYPNVVPPTVQVTTRYPGASAVTLVNTVALPIEQQVNGVENMLYMQSTSADDGTYTLVVTFAIGTDPDKAQILVQNQVASALSSLPQQVQAQGVTTAKKSTSILEFVSLVSPEGRFDSLFLTNYAVINVQNELARLDGVGNVTIFGAGQYAMRIWMNPDLLQARSLTPQDVISAVQQQSQEVAAGQVGAPPAPKGQDFQYTLNAASTIPLSLKTSSSRSMAPMADESRESATLGASSSAPRPTANPSISTAAQPQGSASHCCPTPMRSQSRTKSKRKWRNSRRVSRRASPT
jgi:HAE1 family hydrophobic/amphiphilic exporter-1